MSKEYELWRNSDIAQSDRKNNKETLHRLLIFEPQENGCGELHGTNIGTIRRGSELVSGGFIASGDRHSSARKISKEQPFVSRAATGS